MSSTITLSCTINTTNADSPLGMQIWLDGQLVLEQAAVTQEIKFQHELDDRDSAHCLEFVMQGKTEAHTKISESGEILQDTRLIISDVAFDDIKLGHVFTALSRYEHDFNGTSVLTKEKFYGQMGCNGRVILEFSTPIYLWLLENM